MANVHNTRARIYGMRDFGLDEAPEHLETEGEHLIKDLVQKQLNTRTNLEDELKQVKEFVSVAEVVPVTKFVSGKTTLKEFRHFSNKAAFIEHLKSCGLTDDEVLLITEYESDENAFFDKHKKMMKGVLVSRIQDIYHKIESRNKALVSQGSSSKSNVSRHERELNLVEKPDSEETKLLQFALSCKPSTSDPRPPSHPINQLPQLEEQLFGHLKNYKKNKKAKKAKLATGNEERSTDESKLSDFVYTRNADGVCSLWDMKEVPHPSTSLNDSNKNKDKIIQKVYTCKPEILYTIKDNKIVRLESKPQKNESSTRKCEESMNLKGEAFIVTNAKELEHRPIALSEIKNNRLTLDQIRALPKFNNYEEGTPSQVLYIKNLSSNTKESDLVSIFSRFETEGTSKLIYRLMTGRMKGQAFITFPNVEKATEALLSVNGYLLKGKPLIIQYGKKEPT